VELTKKIEIMKKQLEVTTVMVNDGGKVVDEFYNLTLVVNKQGVLTIFNTLKDGDWREAVDCNTAIVKTINLRAKEGKQWEN